MDYKICPKCGKQLSGSAILCTGCGFLLSSFGDGGITDNNTMRSSEGASDKQIQRRYDTGIYDLYEQNSEFPAKPEENVTESEYDKNSPDSGRKSKKNKEEKAGKKRRSDKRRDKKRSKKKKRAKWPWFLVFVFLVAVFAGILFLSDEENRAWVLSGFSSKEVESSFNADELAQKNIDIYNLYGKSIDNVIISIGEPLKITEIEDDDYGLISDYDYQLFSLDVNQSGKVVSAQVNYAALEDKTVALAYGVNGNMSSEEITMQLGSPNSTDTNYQKLYYYPEDTVVVRYTCNESLLVHARVYYDKNVVAFAPGEEYDSVVEVTSWLGRYISAPEALLGTSRNLGSNSFGGSTHYIDGVTLETNEMLLICRIEVNYSNYTGNSKLLISNLFYGDDKETMLAVMGQTGDQEGSSYTFTRNNIRLTYLLNSSDKILSAAAESSAS